jgi:transposase
MSYERVAGLIPDVFGVGVSEATAVSMVGETGNPHVMNKLETAAIKDVAESPGVDADETGLKIGETTRRARVLAGAPPALFSLDGGRGKAGADATGILGRLHGFAVHDCRRTRIKHRGFLRRLCHARVLGELRQAVETGGSWAAGMRRHLSDLYSEVEVHGGGPPVAMQTQAVKRHGEIKDGGLFETGGRILARPPGQKGKRGRMKRPGGRNLPERLEIREDAAPRLITGGRVPFANNDAGRPARMKKARARTSGRFKTSETARGFRKMRGRVVGRRKNDMSARESIKMVVQGQTPEFVKAGLSSDVR